MMAKGIPFGLVLNSYPNSPVLYKPTAVWKDRFSPAIVVLTSAAAAFLPLLRCRQPRDGDTNQGAAPATISSGLPSNYHSFVVSIMFAFSCALSAMFLDRKRQAARVFRFSAIIWMSFGFVLLVHAIFYTPFSR